MRLEQFDNAERFLSALRRSHVAWNNASCRWVFRGHGDSKYLLHPKLWRQHDQATNPFFKGAEILPADLLENQGALEVTYANRFRAIHRVLLAEQRAVWSFRDLADDLGFAVPTGPVPATESAYTFLSTGLTLGRISDLHQRYPMTHATTLAQHHGVATRLLDWTDAPTTAAYFAASSWLDPTLAKRCDVPGPPADIAVWAIDVGDLQGSELQVVRPSRAANTYMRAQGGLFTWHWGAEDAFINAGQWPEHSEALVAAGAHSENSRERTVKLELTAAAVPDLLALLRREGISRAHLQPTLDNVVATTREWAEADIRAPKSQGAKS